MNEGFPLLTTKKMYWKGIVTELLWFLRGETNIKYLLDNDCHIWDGDTFKKYCNTYKGNFPMDKEEFIEAIKTNPEFARKWGELGPIYGKQWRQWTKKKMYLSTDGSYENIYDEADQTVIDQITNLINDLKTNPDSRRLMVNAWNVGDLDQMVLSPCHYGFQCYTRELTYNERVKLLIEKVGVIDLKPDPYVHLNEHNIPERAISLMWSQRSVDTFLGLPFNIASYGLLLCILAELTNMVPDYLIGSLGDVHLYENHLSQAIEQNNRLPYNLPKLRINSEFWNPENVLSDNYSAIINGMQIDDFQIEGYECHAAIKAPLSN
jgi:thymidylate synthase